MPTLTTINAAKDLEQTFQPLLLVKIVTLSGATLRLCSEGLNTNEGGFPYGGNDFLGRIKDQSLNAFQGHEPGGIDVMSRVSFKVIDVDKVLYLAVERTHGIKPA